MHNRRILIVDDNPDIHEDIKKILAPKRDPLDSKRENLEDALFGTEGEHKKLTSVEVPTYEIHSAFQGQEALLMVEAAMNKNEPFSLLFVDSRMPPGWDGVETIRKIWNKCPYTEIVLCSAFTDYSSADIIRILGASHRFLFLKKPFDRTTVAQMALAFTSKWNFEHQVLSHVESLEQAVKRSTNELTEAQSQLLQSSKMSALGEMAAGLAHEINNPLAVIQTGSGMLQELAKEAELNRADITKISTRIEETVVRISSIIKGLKSFSHDQTGEPFKLESIKQIVDDALNLCAAKLRSHGVTMNIPDIPQDITCQCRATQIVQVLLNLFTNALDAIELLPEKWIKVEVNSLDNEIEIRVTDSGKGITDELREKIFKPFFTTKKIDKGTGLGLSISKTILDAHKGTFDVDTKCENTLFFLRLPKSQPT